MGDLLAWLGDLSNSKIVALLIFFAAFTAILIYVFTGKERSKRLESYKFIPFEEDDGQTEDSRVDRDERNK